MIKMGPVSDLFGFSAVSGTMSVVTDDTNATAQAVIDEKGSTTTGESHSGLNTPNCTSRGRVGELDG